MAKKRNAYWIPRNKFNRIYLMDWSWLDTNDWSKVNASPTNTVWIKATKGYISQQLSWQSTTTFTYSSITYIDSYIWINWVMTKNSSQVTSTALNWVNWNLYFWLYFTNSSLTVDEEQTLKQWWERALAWWWDNILSSAVAHYVFDN